MKKPFYITTTLPFLNADPHIGHATEFVRADVIARVKKLTGYDVFFNTGTDEHGIKIYRKAKEQNKDPQAFVDGYAAKFKALLPALGILPEVTFTRTTDKHHEMAAQEFWKLAKKNGFIYKKNYSVKYCVGCELEKMESELTNGRCPVHPLQELEIIEEENYFFKFSAFQKQLLKLYSDNPTFVIPDTRLNEIKAFVTRGLEDFSISRLKEKMPWGILVPDDDAHVIYVWFDALVNYISAVGWPDRLDSFKRWCVDTGGMVQYCGKDNLRQQSAMWQAMLMSADLPPSKTIVIDGFITGEGGLKMSKSLGNTVDPMEIITEYGTDAFRYYALREMHPFEDSSFTVERFKEAYNAHLANGLGNLVSRVMKMATLYDVQLSEDEKKMTHYSPQATDDFTEDFNLLRRMNDIWSNIKSIDDDIQRSEPFKKIKINPEEARKDVYRILFHLFGVALALEPFMPATAVIIQDLIKDDKMPAEPLFMRK